MSHPPQRTRKGGAPSWLARAKGWASPQQPSPGVDGSPINPVRGTKRFVLVSPGLGLHPDMSAGEPPLRERVFLRLVPLCVSKMRGFRLSQALHTEGSRGLHALAQPGVSLQWGRREPMHISRLLWKRVCIRQKRTSWPLTQSILCAKWGVRKTRTFRPTVLVFLPSLTSHVKSCFTDSRNSFLQVALSQCWRVAHSSRSLA